MGADVFVLVLEDMKREAGRRRRRTSKPAMKRARIAGPPRRIRSAARWRGTRPGRKRSTPGRSISASSGKSQMALNSIIGYMPTVPHWGYNGSRGATGTSSTPAPRGTQRAPVHHYGSGLNAIPALAQYRETPDDFYLLRIGYAGTMGALTNIDQEGFASVAFHSFPQRLRWDAYTGDYGPNFLGHALNTGTYVVNHPEFGWQAFGGNVSTSGDRIRVQVDGLVPPPHLRGAARLYLTLDPGSSREWRSNPNRRGARHAGAGPMI